MNLNKAELLKNLCYTTLVYGRINKKLKTTYSTAAIEKLIVTIISETPLTNYLRIGKNIYVSSNKHNIKITINSNTCRIITVDRIVK
jgi:hypothetical protein